MTQDNKELATTQPGALMEMPSDLVQDAGRGTENIGQDDVRPPRILICQAGSPQRKPDDAKEIPGLKELDIFNDLSGEIYGRGPLKFAVIQAYRPRYILFAPMDEGGGVLDFDVKPTIKENGREIPNPLVTFTTAEDGSRQKPAATKFYDYLVWLLEQQEPAILSLKSSQIKVAVQLNGKMKLPLKGEAIDPSLKGQVVMNPPAWARTFSLTTVMEKADTYSWGNYNLRMEGVTPPEARQLCKQLADSFAQKNVIIEREPGDEAMDFDPSKMGADAGM